jgi:hypothetical protein
VRRPVPSRSVEPSSIGEGGEREWEDRHLGDRRRSVIGPVQAAFSAAWFSDSRGLRCVPARRDSITGASATTRVPDFEDYSCSGSTNPVTMAPLEPASRPGGVRPASAPEPARRRDPKVHSFSGGEAGSSPIEGGGRCTVTTEGPAPRLVPFPTAGEVRNPKFPAATEGEEGLPHPSPGYRWDHHPGYLALGGWCEASRSGSWTGGAWML